MSDLGDQSIWVMQLLGNYTAAVDAGDAERVAAVLRDAVLTFKGCGPYQWDDIVAFYREAFSRPAPRTLHTALVPLITQLETQAFRFAAHYLRYEIQGASVSPTLAVAGTYWGEVKVSTKAWTLTAFQVNQL